MPQCTWLQKVIPSPLADHLPTALARSMPPGEEPPAQFPARGKERAKGHQPMEYTNWIPQAVASLIIGVLVTTTLAAATAHAFIKGEK